MSSIHELVTKAARLRESIRAIEERNEEMRVTAPLGERHARVLRELIAVGEGFIEMHERDLRQCMRDLAGEMARMASFLVPPRTDLPAAFDLPVVAAGAQVVPLPAVSALLQK